MPSASAQAAATGRPSSESGVPSTQATRWSTPSGRVAVSSSGSGWTTKGPATTTGSRRAVDDVARRGTDERAGDSSATVGRQADQAGVELVERSGARPPATSVSTSTWMRGSSGSVPRACAASAADALQLEVGDHDGDRVDGGAEPRRERAGGRRARRRRRGSRRAGRGSCGRWARGARSAGFMVFFLRGGVVAVPPAIVRASATTHSATRSHAAAAACSPGASQSWSTNDAMLAITAMTAIWMSKRISHRSGRRFVVAIVRALARTRPATGRSASVASELGGDEDGEHRFVRRRTVRQQRCGREQRAGERQHRDADRADDEGDRPAPLADVAPASS